MIAVFEELLRTVLAPAVGGSLDRIGFLPPNSTWRSLVTGSSLLNVYLIELRENRKLRSSTGSGPVRIDCHYVISAWYPTSTSIPPANSQPPGNLSSTRRESQLLYEAAARILERTPLVPSSIIASATAWSPYENHQIPVSLIPPEGFPKLPELWGTLGGADNLWKPVLHLIATLPLDLPQSQPGAPITKIVVHISKDGEPAESRITITGTVEGTAGNAISGAHLTLSRAGTLFGHAQSAGDGSFLFEALPDGHYTLDATDGNRHGSIGFTPTSAASTYTLQLS